MTRPPGVPGPRSRPTPSTEAIAERFREDYHRFQYAFVEFLSQHLADVSRTFGGDLQSVMILAILGQRLLQHRLEAGRAEREGRTLDWAPTMTAARLADVTGIPRETIRRKLASLVARGWIERASNGGYAIAVHDGEAPARRDLSELDRRGIDRAARLLADLWPIV